jgi:hypothetical protein
VCLPHVTNMGRRGSLARTAMLQGWSLYSEYTSCPNGRDGAICHGIGRSSTGKCPAWRIESAEIPALLSWPNSRSFFLPYLNYSSPSALSPQYVCDFRSFPIHPEWPRCLGFSLQLRSACLPFLLLLCTSRKAL